MNSTLRRDRAQSRPAPRRGGMNGCVGMLVWAILLSPSLVLLTGAGCPGPEGPQGPAGSPGPGGPQGPDDLDDIPAENDNCPGVTNSDQADDDADGIGNACDNCPTLANVDQADANGNGIGDACEPIGIWQKTGGDAFSNLTDFSLQFLTFNTDGTALLTFQKTGTGVLRCNQAFFATIDASSLIIEAPGLTDSTRLLHYQLTDANSLTLTDSRGASSTLTRVTEVPVEFQCQTLTILRTFENLLDPDGFTGLAYDGTLLWYEEEDNRLIHPFDPATGTFGPPVLLDNSQFSHVHAMQGADFWAHCGCGNGEDVQRRTQADVLVDTVNTNTDLGNQISVRGIAFDSTANVLWLHGFSFNDRVNRFLRVNAEVEPDVLLEAVDFDVILTSIAFDGTNLWGILGFGPGQEIVQIDPATFQAIATFESPNPQVSWRGIAATGTGTLFLLGETDSGQGIIIEVSP